MKFTPYIKEEERGKDMGMEGLFNFCSCSDDNNKFSKWNGVSEPNVNSNTVKLYLRPAGINKVGRFQRQFYLLKCGYYRGKQLAKCVLHSRLIRTHYPGVHPSNDTLKNTRRVVSFSFELETHFTNRFPL